ncbi:MAG TPA: hypothetical protein VGJ15_00940, partial [Pirellulales bacterium]
FVVSTPVGDKLEINDQSGPLGSTYNLGASMVQRTGIATINYSGIESLDLFAASSIAALNISGTADGSKTTIGTKTVTGDVGVTTTGVGSQLLFIDVLASNSITIAGTGQNSTVILNTDSADDNVTVQSSGAGSGIQLNTGAGADHVIIQNTGPNSGVRLVAGDGTDTIDVYATGAGSATDLSGGNDSDVFNIGGPTQTLSNILGDMAITGDGGSGAAFHTPSVTVNGVVITQSFAVGDVVNINDQGFTNPGPYDIDPSSIQREGTGKLNIQVVNTINLNAGWGDNQITVDGSPKNAFFTINGNSGKDNVALENFSGELIVNLLGNDDQLDDFDTLPGGNWLQVFGGAGNDVMHLGVLSLAVKLVDLEGEAGNDQISFDSVSVGRNVLLSGGDDDDTIGVNTVGGGSVVDLQGGAGVDTFTIGDGTTNALQGNVVVSGGSGTDVFNPLNLTSISSAGMVSVDGGGNGESLTTNVATAATVNISSMQVQRTGNGAVTYSGIANLAVNGTAGVDTFNVSATAAGTATSINAAGGLDLFGNIDLTQIGAAGLSIDGGGNGESLTLNTTTAGTISVSSTAVQRSGNGAVNYSGLANLTINGTSAADTFNVASTNGSTATTINAAGGLDLFGNIDLTQIGAAGLAINAGGDGESLTLNTTTVGTVNITSTSVQRSGNGAVNYSGLANLTVNGTGAADTLNVLSTTAATVTTVNAGGGLDVLGNIDLTQIGVAGLTIDGGGNGESLTLNTTTAGTVTVSSIKVQRSGNGAVTYAGLAQLVVNGTAGTDVLNVLSTASGVTTTLNAGGGNDAITVGNAGLMDGILGALNIHGQADAGSPGDTLHFDDSANANGLTYTLTSTTLDRTGIATITFDTLETVLLDTGTGADTANIKSTAATVATTINSGDGNDAITLGNAGLLDGILGTVAIHGQGNAASPGDTLHFDDSANANGLTYTLTSTTLNRTGIATITFDTIEGVLLDTGTGADTVNVKSTAATVATTINTGDGNDAITLGNAGLLDGILGTIAIHGQGQTAAPGDSLHFDDSANANGLTYTLTATTLDRTGIATITFETVESVLLDTGTGADTLNIKSTAATVASTINTSDGNDSITLGNAGLLDGILGAIAIHGQPNAASPTTSVTCLGVTNTLARGDLLHFDDSASAVGLQYNLTAGTFQRTGTTLVTFDGMETLVLDAGTQADAITVTGTNASTNVTVNGNAGSDTITLVGNGATSSVILDGGAGDDTLNVQAVAAGSIVEVDGGSENDTINVSSNAPANTGTLDAIVGNLCIDTGTSAAGGTDRIILSDQNQTALANSGVLVQNNIVDKFAGPTNNVKIHYEYDTLLELTLIGSQTLNDKFDVQLSSYKEPSALTLRFDGLGQPAGGMDSVRIDGTTGNDTVRVGTFGNPDPLGQKYLVRVQNIECLQMFGGTGNDMLQNDTNVSSLIDGGDGNDTLIGGSAVDVIFGGDGADTIYGRSGGDFLFADHEFNNRSPRVKHSNSGDKVYGDLGLTATDPFATMPGVDTIVTIGGDVVNAGGQVGDTIIGQGTQLSVQDWLRARFLKPTSKNIQDAINKALKEPCTMI